MILCPKVVPSIQSTTKNHELITLLSVRSSASHTIKIKTNQRIKLIKNSFVQSEIYLDRNHIMFYFYDLLQNHHFINQWIVDDVIAALID